MVSSLVYRLLVRDASLAIVAEIDQYSQCTIQPRFNGLGAWVLELPADTDAAGYLVEGSGLVVMRNGLVVMSGPMVRREDHSTEEGDVVIVSGYDDTLLLADRTAWPCPWPFTATDSDVRVGAAETVMRGYVQANAVTGGVHTGVMGTKTREPATGFAVEADQGRGATVTGRARFVNLLEVLTDLALSGGDLGFRVAQTLTVPPTLTFQVYVPEDRTGTAVFSREMGNLQGYEYVTEASTGNAILVAGQGVGAARTFRERTDQTSIALHGRRVEVFIDRRDAVTLTELDQTGDEDLLRRADRGQLKLVPLDTEGLAFLSADEAHTYRLGDRVTVLVRGIPVQDIVREVRITLTVAGGERVEPVVGTPGAVLTHSDTYVLRHLHRRVSLQERQ